MDDPKFIDPNWERFVADPSSIIPCYGDSPRQPSSITDFMMIQEGNGTTDRDLGDGLRKWWDSMVAGDSTPSRRLIEELHFCEVITDEEFEACRESWPYSK